MITIITVEQVKEMGLYIDRRGRVIDIFGRVQPYIINDNLPF